MSDRNATAIEGVAAIALSCAKQDLSEAATRSEVTRVAKALGIYSAPGLTDVADCLATFLVVSLEAAERRRGRADRLPAQDGPAEQAPAVDPRHHPESEQRLWALDVVQKLAHNLQRR